MTTSERIESLLEDCQAIQISRPAEPNAPKFFIRADQLVETGAKGNFAAINHQTIGESIADCLEQLTKQVTASGAMKRKGLSPILTRNGGRE